MPSSWPHEIWRLITVLAICLVVGLLQGQVLVFLLLGTSAGLGWYLYNLYRLHRWLAHPRSADIPLEPGAWGDLYYRVLRMQAHNQARKRKLRDLLAQFRASAEALPDAAVALSSEWEIRWFNEAAVHLLSLRPGVDVGSPIQNLFRSPDLSGYLDKGDFERDLEINAPGNNDLKLSIRVIPYGDHQWLLLAQDITERYRLERVRKDFVANVSHELRTPLTVLSGFIENIQHDETAPECVQRWERPLSLMDQQAGRMRRIVEDLLLLARLESMDTGSQQTPVDVAVMAEEILEDAHNSRPEGHAALHLALRTNSLLLGDPGQLRSAFSNLVLNAVNYTPESGSITVKWYQDGDTVCFEVEDTGEGISGEHLPRLTERFYRVDAGRSRKRGGTGLGLAIVKHVLQHHDAELEITSQPGSGSRFVCRFPGNRRIQPQSGQASHPLSG